MDLAVGACNDDDGGQGSYKTRNVGAVYMLFMNTDGSVKDEQKISSTQGGLKQDLLNFSLFGRSVAGLGDLDTDKVVDLVVGAASYRSAVFILFLDKDGTVSREQMISAGKGGLVAEPLGGLPYSDWFGYSVAKLDDMDGDGVVDLAVGAPAEKDEHGTVQGALYILLMNKDGSVKREGKFDGALLVDSHGEFGASVVSVGDLDGDGVMSLAVGSGKPPGSVSGSSMHVIKVPPGFVPVCGDGEWCANAGRSGAYECTPTTV